MLPTTPCKLPQSRLSTLFAVLSITLLLAVMSASLIACASNSSSAQSPTPTTPVQAQKCGSVQTNPRGVPLNEPAAKQAEDCFWQAF